MQRLAVKLGNTKKRRNRNTHGGRLSAQFTGKLHLRGGCVAGSIDINTTSETRLRARAAMHVSFHHRVDRLLMSAT